MKRPILLLCGGLQSSGSTLVSWCFLQRKDTDGVLDSLQDTLFAFPAERPAPPYLWCKFTISAFRFRDVMRFYEDAGFSVRRLLVARDTRSAFGSLAAKDYGRNGLTAEDPPLRMRFLRFRDDWLEFQQQRCPVLRFESLVADPEPTLREACRQLDVPWDPGMLTWPKAANDLASSINGNPTFLRSLGPNLAASLQPEKGAISAAGIAREDVEWLEREFREYNEALGYPLRVEPVEGPAAEVAAGGFPAMAVTRRAEQAAYAEKLRQHYTRLEEQNAIQAADVARLVEETRQRAAEIERALEDSARLRGELAEVRQELGGVQKELAAAQETLNRYWDYPAKVEEIERLRSHLALYENHPLLGPVIRFRRRLKGLEQ